MTTATNRLRQRTRGAPELRAEQARLEAERPRLASICEIRSMGARHDRSRRDGGPLQGIGVEYDGEVTGLSGITHADEAAARLREVDERLAEIEAAMPAAEKTEHEEQLRAQQEDERRREQRVQDAIEATRAKVAEVEVANAAMAEARAYLDYAITASPLGALLNTRRVALEARNAVAHALAGAGSEEAQARVLDALGDDARRALPGLHTKAAPPAATAERGEYDWLIDALLNLPQLRTAVNELNLKMIKERR
jgi:hypothetical protein